MPDPLLAQVTQTFLRAVGESAIQEARLRMRSKTLQATASYDVTQGVSVHRVRLHVPYYWALYDHEGRDAIRFPPGRYMVFFPDVRDDPRVSGGKDYPRTKADRRKLTKQEFQHFSRINYQRALKGQPSVMVVTQRVGPSAARPFFREAAVKLNDSGLLGDLAALSLGHYLSVTTPRGRARVVMNL